MSATFDAGVVPALTNSMTDEVWFYRRDDQTMGPVSEKHLLDLLGQKILDGSTLIWREEFGTNWKRLDQSRMWRERPTPPPPPATEQQKSYSPRWQKVFDAAAAEESIRTIFNRSGARISLHERSKIQWRLRSIPGFLFGPLYYFYLRMWRKGLFLLALVPVVVCIETVVGDSKLLDLAVPALCATLVKRDYYRFCMKGERVWPILKWSKNIWTDAALVTALSLACVFTGVAFDKDDDVVAPKKAQAATKITAPSAPVKDVALTTPTEDPANVLSVTKHPGDPNSGVYHLTITSRTDMLRVTGVRVNRGSCRSQSIGPNSLQFGETLDILAVCNPIEAQIMTNHGSFPITWDD